LVAIYTKVVVNLELQRTIAKSAAALHAFSTTYTKMIINGILIKWVFNEFAVNGTCRAELSFSSG
jgi:hypothetical protein